MSFFKSICSIRSKLRLLQRLLSGHVWAVQPVTKHVSNEDGGMKLMTECMLELYHLTVWATLKKLKDIGITGIINTMHEYGGNLKALQTFDIEQLYLPVVDHYAPTLEQTEQGVVFIQRHLDAGGAVLVHCKGGHGRSAAIGFAWLLKNRKMTLEQTQKHILSHRKVRRRLAQQTELIQFHRKYVLGLSMELDGKHTDIEKKKLNSDKDNTKRNIVTVTEKDSAKVFPADALQVA